MPQEQAQARGGAQTRQNEADETSQTVRGKASAQADGQIDALDAVLDDIESTLETNAEEYVSSFVQKGGE